MKFLFLNDSSATSISSSLDSSTSVIDTNAMLSSFLEKVIHWAQTTGIKLLIGLIALFILFKLINYLSRRIRKRLLDKKHDETITNVIYEIIRKVLKVVLFIMFLGYVGIDTAGIGSIIASCAVAIGLALQGSLANIAGWFIIIFMRPFKFGDYINCQGVEGTVEDIKLFYTYLKTPDNKVIMVPNGALANGNIINYSIKKNRRVDLTFGVSYDSDIKKVISIIEEIIAKHDNILKEPEPFVKLGELATSSINIKVRVWTLNGDYWTVYFELLQEVKDAFDANKIEIPYNQIDVHINQKN